MSKVNFQPEGAHTITPYLTLKDAPSFIKFVSSVFGAIETERVTRTDGSIMHAEVRIGDSTIMISEACDEMGMGEKPASLYLYVENADSVFHKAVEAGATPFMEPADMFWGDRFSNVKDKWGNDWSISTHIEDVDPEELKIRGKKFAEQMELHNKS
jgi:PhnB protein